MYSVLRSYYQHNPPKNNGMDACLKLEIVGLYLQYNNPYFDLCVQLTGVDRREGKFYLASFARIR